MNETLKTIHSLRTIHGDFSEREVSPADLRTILDALVRAASASGMQNYSVIVVEDKTVMKELLGYVGSKALIFCVDENRLADLADHLGYDGRVKGLRAFLTGAVNTILAAQTAAIAAKSLGVDSLFTNAVHRGDMARVWRLLNLPAEGCYPLIALVLGYPKKEPDHLRGRLAGPGVIHFGKYHRLATEELDALVAEYDDPGRHLGSTTEWPGYAHYLDWFFAKWRGLPKKGQRQEPSPKTVAADAQLEELLRRAEYLTSEP